jgi:hypothetical protein
MRSHVYSVPKGWTVLVLMEEVLIASEKVV